MKPSALILPLAVVVTSISAWSFEVDTSPSSFWFGSANKGCTKKNIPEGTFWRWDRDPSENCCLRLWANNACSGDYLGWTCNNLDHTTTNYMRAFEVTNC